MITTDIELFPDIYEISKKFKGVLLDAFGVFWGGDGMGIIPGAKEMMERLVAEGKTVGILSNATHQTFKEVNKMERHGLQEGRHFHFFITSGTVAKNIFTKDDLPFPTPRKRYWSFGDLHPKYSSHRDVFIDTHYRETDDINDADFIWVSVPNICGEDTTDPLLFKENVARMKKSGLPLVCPNPDRFAIEGKPPRPVVRQGTIAALYEELGGSVFYIGKPYSVMYENAMRYFSQWEIHSPADVLMVGDTPETDIRGANIFNMPSALIITTGIMGDRISRGDLKTALEELPSGDTPDFFIERLGTP